MVKAASASQKLLEEVFPAEYITRNVGHKINYPAQNAETCSDYIDPIVTNTTTAN